MIIKFILLILVCCFFYPARAQLNVELLHQLVSESQSENDRQKQAKDKQVITSANEEVNKTQLNKLKNKYREIQSRFKTLGVVLDAAQVGLQATPIVNDIIHQQSLIFQFATNDPILIAMAYNAEVDMAQKAYSLTNYLYGLFISVGDLNQMKASDRKMLFGHVVSELRAIAGAARGLANTMYYSNRKKVLKSLNPFQEYINQDKSLVDGIIRNSSLFKY